MEDFDNERIVWLCEFISIKEDCRYTVFSQINKLGVRCFGFKEDNSRVRTDYAPENLSLLRK